MMPVFSHPPKTRTERPARRLPVCRCTLDDAPCNLMILVVLEDKAKNFARDLVRHHIKPSELYASNPRIKACADMILDIASRHDGAIFKALSLDDQCRLADLCQHYDDLLDEIVAGMREAVQEYTLGCPKALRELWARSVSAGYVGLVAVLFQNVLRDRYGCIFKLNGCLVDSLQMKYLAEKCDTIVTEIWGGDVNLAKNKIYDKLDTDFCQKLTNPDFFYRAAANSGFTQFTLNNNQ